MAFADDNPDLLSLPSREYIKPTEESKKEEAVAKASAEAKKTAGRESKRMGVYSNRIEDISVTKKLEDISVTKKMEDIPKPPIAQPKLKETAEISAEVPFKPPEPGSEADNYFKGVIQKAVEDTAIELAKTFPTSAQAEDIARSTLPRAFDGLGNLPGFGTYMQIGPSGAAMWGGAPDSGTSDMDYSDFAFGFSISGAVVTVNAGKVRYGTRTAVSVATDDINIEADQTWVFVSYIYGGAGTLTSSTSEPVDTETVHNHALYLVTLAEGVASVAAGNIKHLGDIFIPGAFA